MKDREVILRYLSFRWFDYENLYSGDMSDFVENAMKKINKKSDEEIQIIKNDFRRVMKISYSIWQYKNFRIPTDVTRGTINIAIFETVCNYLSTKSDDFIAANKSKIKNNYTTLIRNSTYFEAVTKSTGNKAKVREIGRAHV